MRKKITRLVCLLLSAMILLGAMPTTVFSELSAALPKTDADGTYLIGTAEELFAFAELAKAKAEEDSAAGSKRTALSARLTADINLNPGVTFTYHHETGLATVAKGDKSYQMGTGMKGTELGIFHPIYNGLCTEEEWNARTETEEEVTELERKRAAWTAEMNEKVAALGLHPWIPIGKENLPYIGYFDGNGHTIDGLYINDKTIVSTGLFGVLGNDTYLSVIDDYGEVKNLTIGENSLIIGYGSAISGYGSTGAVVGRTKSAGITACINRAAVIGKGSQVPGSASAGLVGGVAGYVNGKVQSCVNYGTVVSRESAGGVVGNVMGSIYDRGTLLFCRNYGRIYADTTGTADGYAGGIAVNAGGTKYAYDYAGAIEGCVNYGYVEGRRAGGILWRGGRDVHIQYCANHGQVTATEFAAGIVENIGRDSFTMKGCYNAGKVEVLPTSEDGDTTAPAGSAYPFAATIYTYSTDGKPTSHTIKNCYNDKTVCPAEDDALFGEKIEATDCFSVTTDFFATGEPAYRMGSNSGSGWRQKLPVSAEGGNPYPSAEGSDRVYEQIHNCCHTDDANRKAHRKILYTNESGTITDPHTPDESGICTHCGMDVRLPIFLADTLPDAKVGRYYETTILLDDRVPMVRENIKATVSETDDTTYSFSCGLDGKADYSYSSKYYYRISGTPTAAGTLTFTLVAKNENGVTKKTYTLKIEEADPLEITTDEKLDNATAEEGYWRRLSTNTSLSATWALADGSALPEGLTLDGDGTISGTPTTAGKYTFAVTVSAGTQSATKTFTLIVLEAGGCRHGDMKKIAGTQATCQRDGIADHYHCSICENDFEDAAGKKQIWSKDTLQTAATHTDRDSNGKCDLCGKNMPVFRRVTKNDDIVYGGTYILVTKIGGKYYALTAPDGNADDRAYSNFMLLREMTPYYANGDFRFSDLAGSGILMLTTGFAVESGELDAGTPRYGLSTILDNKRFGLMGDDYSPVFSMYPNEPAKYGYRIALNASGEALIGSVYQSWWSTPATAENGLLRAFDMTYNGKNTKFLSFFPAKEYNGEGAEYSGAAMTECPLYLYRMTDIGVTPGGINYTVNDENSSVGKGSFSELPDAIDLSNVSGMTGATDSSYVESLIDGIGTTEEDVAAGIYAAIAAIDMKAAASLKYSVTPILTITDRSGNVLYQGSLPDEKLNGTAITVTLYTGGIVPEQIVHYKEDGSREYFYSKWSEEAARGAKTFVYENGYVTFTIDSFSEIEILAKAVAEVVTPKGDLNGDGTVDEKDLELLRKYLVSDGKITLSAADLNSDGKIDCIDLILLRKKLAEAADKKGE